MAIWAIDRPPFSANSCKYRCSCSSPSVRSRSIAAFLKKGLVISFFDSACARVAVCRQARKPAMSVAENTLLDDSNPQRQQRGGGEEVSSHGKEGDQSNPVTDMVGWESPLAESRSMRNGLAS